LIARGTHGVLVHEWVAQSGGSENVFEAFSEIYPGADLLCLWNDSSGRFPGRKIDETWLARTPLRRSKVAALPFMPATWRHLEDHDYEWALISSHLFAHHARFGGPTSTIPRFVYVHSPARYIWNPDLDQRGSGLALRAASVLLKPWDWRRAQEGARFAANSGFVRERIAKAWQVDSRVIYPPVEVEAIQEVSDWRTELTPAEEAVLTALPEGYVLGASRFIPYKRLDLVIDVGVALGRPVVLAGRGPEVQRLRALAAEAAVPVHLVESPSTALLRALYQGTDLFVFPAVEDFGIMPVEAMAAGAPVLAQAVGGTSESVVPGRTGALVTFDDPTELVPAAELAISTRRDDRLEHARNFSRSRFNDEVGRWVNR
jgi:glycosyltransferase involved in cell wall biosynthesis